MVRSFLPHTPHNPPQRLLKKYQKEGRGSDLVKYYAMCEWFDETCGELLGYIDEKNLTDNTMVVYICDNGWAAPSTNSDDPDEIVERLCPAIEKFTLWRMGYELQS